MVDVVERERRLVTSGLALSLAPMIHLHTLVHDAPVRARMGAASREIISHHALAA